MKPVLAQNAESPWQGDKTPVWMPIPWVRHAFRFMFETQTVQSSGKHLNLNDLSHTTVIAKVFATESFWSFFNTSHPMLLAQRQVCMVVLRTSEEPSLDRAQNPRKSETLVVQSGTSRCDPLNFVFGCILPKMATIHSLPICAWFRMGGTLNPYPTTTETYLRYWSPKTSPTGDLATKDKCFAATVHRWGVWGRGGVTSMGGLTHRGKPKVQLSLNHSLLQYHLAENHSFERGGSQRQTQIDLFSCFQSRFATTGVAKHESAAASVPGPSLLFPLLAPSYVCSKAWHNITSIPVSAEKVKQDKPWPRVAPPLPLWYHKWHRRALGLGQQLMHREQNRGKTSWVALFWIRIKLAANRP